VKGFTPLHIAIGQSSAEDHTTQIITELFKSGADVNAIRFNQSSSSSPSAPPKTPLDLAVKKGRWAIAEELCKRGAILSGQNMKPSSTQKWPLLHSAGSCPPRPPPYLHTNIGFVIKVKQGKENLIRIILETGGVSIDEEDSNGWTPLVCIFFFSFHHAKFIFLFNNIVACCCS